MHKCVHRTATFKLVGVAPTVTSILDQSSSIDSPSSPIGSPSLVGAAIGIPLALVVVALVGFALVRWRTKKTEHDYVQHTTTNTDAAPILTVEPAEGGDDSIRSLDRLQATIVRFPTPLFF